MRGDHFLDLGNMVLKRSHFESVVNDSGFFNEMYLSVLKHIIHVLMRSKDIYDLSLKS